MNADALLNAYIDLNLLFLAAVVLWLLMRRGLSTTRAGKSYLPQLRVLNILTLALPLAPFVVVLLSYINVRAPSNISDLLVAQYLQGNVSMSATKFETLLGLREDAVRALILQQTLWAKVITYSIIAGSVFYVLSLFASLIKLRQVVYDSFLYKRIGKVELRVSQETQVAFSTRGFFRHFVVIPAPLLDRPADLRMTVAHELQHFRHRDIEYEFLLELLRPILFWNPAYFLWRRDVRALREFACDQVLMRRLNFDARDYCECLIRACADAVKQPNLFMRRSPVVPLVNQREIRRSSALAKRIFVVTMPRSPVSMPVTWTFITVILVGAIFYSAILLQRSNDWTHDRIMLSTIVNLERMANRAQLDPVVATNALTGSFTVGSP
ncbi:Signal transducer regulating beta-lactamase production, contains metallopeptidase domain [Epibacterium ulvae]|uniref:Signal transducer regulating beta-lactamase production, contains metallopeptidase domain n=1 Tax=Epibacterium ulvae TaxID=1156985 RepID=A0A1G5PM73_9RHOB|nr:M56 family metallopeptidase [Epibacterium ulvae]SCZ50655.1 Signal transducer regulating beta-lactamase production, contains metallopeptidase domain [Epibacterium ulvae]